MPLRSPVRARRARTFTSARYAAGGPREAGRVPRRAPGSPSLRWRRRQLSDAALPALPGVVASEGGSVLGRNRTDSSFDPPVQRRPQIAWKRKKSGGKGKQDTATATSNTKQEPHIRALRRASPGSDVSGGGGARAVLQSGFFPRHNSLLHQVPGVALTTPAPGLAVTLLWHWGFSAHSWLLGQAIPVH